MNVSEAQREMRTIYEGGFAGGLVAGLLWAVSASLHTWVSPRAGILALVFGGMAIFPVTQLLLLAMGRRASLSPGNPLRELAMEVAFLVPLLLPLVGAAALHKPAWFYPAMMLVVGAHYLPFSFLYGMRAFLVLGSALFSAGLMIGLYAPGLAVHGAWFTAAALWVFAFAGRALVRGEAR